MSSEEEIKKLSVDLLQTLLDRVKNGEIVLGTLNQSLKHTRVYDNATQKWEYFRIGGGSMGWTYTTPGSEALEKVRLEQFLVDHPDAELVDNDYAPTVQDLVRKHEKK